MALERGDLIRHFAVTTIDGRLFDYDDTRQRRNLLLVALPGLPLSDSAQEYVSKMTSRDDGIRSAIRRHDGACGWRCCDRARMS
jgi:hypothetical protein